MECLNNGTCNGETGLCICPSEYEGQYCNVMKCEEEGIVFPLYMYAVTYYAHS